MRDSEYTALALLRFLEECDSEMLDKAVADGRFDPSALDLKATVTAWRIAEAECHILAGLFRLDEKGDLPDSQQPNWKLSVLWRAVAGKCAARVAHEFEMALEVKAPFI